MRSNKASEARPRSGTRRNGADTRHKILVAAELLFARQGLRATSLREIARTAGVHQPSLHYHFRDKREVFRAALDLNVVPLYQARLAALDELEASGGGDDVARIISVGQRPIIEAWQRPLAPGVNIVDLLYRPLIDPDPEWVEFGEEVAMPVRERYVAALARALPHMGRVELLERLTFLQGALLGLYLDRSEAEMGRSLRALRQNADAFERRIVQLCSSVLEAPVIEDPTETSETSETE